MTAIVVFWSESHRGSPRLMASSPATFRASFARYDSPRTRRVASSPAGSCTHLSQLHAASSLRCLPACVRTSSSSFPIICSGMIGRHPPSLRVSPACPRGLHGPFLSSRDSFPVLPRSGRRLSVSELSCGQAVPPLLFLPTPAGWHRCPVFPGGHDAYEIHLPDPAHPHATRLFDRETCRRLRTAPVPSGP